MGRAILKSLKESTLLTFFQIVSEWKIKDHWKYNSIDGTLTYIPNGSQIYLKDLFLYPSDPEFDSLGSTEFTGAFIDECSQVSQKAKNIVSSRLRFKLEEFGLIPKLLLTSNPSKNFLYYEFYKPWREKTLPKYRDFIPALVQDNPYISAHYIENLKKLDRVSKERLLYGNFEYDDDPTRIFEYDDICSIFNNLPQTGNEKFLSVDVARFGKDHTTICLWNGFHIKKIYDYAKTGVDEVVGYIKELCTLEGIPLSKVIIDEDGVGGGVVDFLKGAKGFVNNSSAIVHKRDERGQHKVLDYRNLKTQCYFKLAELVTKGKISCYGDVPEAIKERIIEDLEQIKRKDPDKEGKVVLVSKEEMKEKLGRSPDFGDAIMMRMFFEVHKQKGGFFFG